MEGGRREDESHVVLGERRIKGFEGRRKGPDLVEERCVGEAATSGCVYEEVGGGEGAGGGSGGRMEEGEGVIDDGNGF